MDAGKIPKQSPDGPNPPASLLPTGQSGLAHKAEPESKERSGGADTLSEGTSVNDRKKKKKKKKKKKQHSDWDILASGLKSIFREVNKGLDPNNQIGGDEKHQSSKKHDKDVLLDQLGKLEGLLRAIATENAVLQDKIDQLQERLESTLENSKLFLGPQEVDQDVKNVFLLPYQRLKSWSTAFVTNRDSSAFPRYSKLERKYKSLITTALGQEGDLDTWIRHKLKDKSFRRRFVEGIIGAFIYHNLLSLFDESGLPIGHDYWTEPECAKALYPLETHLASQSVISSRELNDWRAYTFFLISKLSPNGVVIERTKLHLQNESKDLIELVGCLAKEGTDPILLQSELIEILDLAINFVKLIRRQRARFSVKYPGPFNTAHSSSSGAEGPVPIKIPFDKATMLDSKGNDEDDDETQPNPNAIVKNVNIFIFPGLFKSGNADGEMYDVEECIVKSVVNCHKQSSRR